MVREVWLAMGFLVGSAACDAEAEFEFQSDAMPTATTPIVVLPAEDTTFTIAILPDTQGYSQVYPDIWQIQTDWLVENKDVLNLKFVIHLGDLVEGSWVTEQWDVAVDSMYVLSDADIPFVIAPGNHDYGEVYESRNARDRSTLLHSYFPRGLFERMATFGDFYPETDRVDNSYHTFVGANERWLIMALEFGPRDSVLSWADAVLQNHPDHRVIIATHAYLYSDDTRYDWSVKGAAQMWSPHTYGIASLPEGVNDGQEIWDELVQKHANIVSVINGHVLNDGLGYAVSNGAGTTHEMLVNYQMNPFAGGGYLRLLHFDTETKLVQVQSYSPWSDSYKTDPGNEFEFVYTQ